MRMLVVNQYYSPDKAASGQILASLCEGLAEKGFQIDVVCGFPSYTEDAQDAPAYEEKGNLTIQRVKAGGVKKGRSGMMQRIQGYVGFLLSAFIMVYKRSQFRSYDLVITLSNPPFVGLLGVFVKRFRGTKYIYVLHDIHPDILIRTQRLNKGIITKVWNFINKIILNTADVVVVLGSRMAEHLSERKGVLKDKIIIIPNWSFNNIKPISRNNSFRHTYNLDDNVVVLYAGNMGISHNLEWLIDAASELKGRKIKFVFVGQGEKRFLLQKQACEQQLDNIFFLPYQDEDVLNEMLCAADVCVVALEPVLSGLAVPSKTYPILAAGRPILALISYEDDVAAALKKYQCGWVANSKEEVVNIIQKIEQSPDMIKKYGYQARIAYEKEYSRDIALERYAQLIQEIVG